MARWAHVWRRAVEHYRRHGARRTIRRVIDEIEARRQRRFSRSTVRPVVSEVAPGIIRAHVDAPREGAPEGSSHLVVSGWAYSPGQQTEVEVYVDRQPRASTIAEQPRPDVAATEHGSGAASSGFSVRVPIADLGPGRHVIQLVFRDDAGHVRVLMPSFRRIEPASMYDSYYRRSLPTHAELAALEARTRARSDLPPIHLVLRARSMDGLDASLASIAAQSYPSWTCTVVADGADLPAVERSVEATRTDGDGRWRVTAEVGASLPEDLVPMGFVGLMEAGERLAPGALLEFARASEDDEPALIYSDHDSVLPTEQHIDPWFVPDWSPDRLLGQDYVGGIYLARTDEELRPLIEEHLGSMSPAWRYALFLALSADRAPIVHVARVLWSRPPPNEAQDARAGAERDAAAAIVARRDAAASVRTSHVGPAGPARRIAWSSTGVRRVSIVIPTTGRMDLVSETLDYLTTRTAYPDLEVIFVDNSRGREPDGIALLAASPFTVVERDEAFNWAKLNNDGASAASGDLLLFLNDDMTVTDPDWLSGLVQHAIRADVGAVGAMLTYPDGRIQHAGVMVVGHGGGAAHLLHGLGQDDPIYLDMHRVTREVTAVTGACLMVERDAFDEVGGFDEDLAVIGNDVDFCLRLAATGRRTLWTPLSILVHRESASRSAVDHIPDEGRMWRRWSGQFLAGDPYYNPNLAEDRVDCGLDWSRVEDRVDPLLTSDPASGVNLVGYIRAEMGIGEATRGEAQAMTDVGLPFVIIDHQGGNPARMEDRTWLHRIVEAPVFGANLLHINADVLPVALTQLPDGLARGRRNIGYWTWELPEFPERWHGSFDLVDEVWVPSTFVQAAIAAGAPVPVHVVPHAVRQPTGPFLGRDAFGLPDDAYLFLAMYDTQSVQQRKNPRAAVDAFLSAFDDDPSAALVLKVNSGGARELRALQDIAEQRRNVHLIDRVLTRHEVDSLMAVSDAFVSLHRSEGFGLPIAEAMALARPVIATGWSGNMDFMSPRTAACVAYELIELETNHGPYDAGGRWAEPDVEDAAAWMRRLRDDPDEGRRMGASGARSIAETNGSRVVGARIAQLLR